MIISEIFQSYFNGTLKLLLKEKKKKEISVEKDTKTMLNEANYLMDIPSISIDIGGKM
jgi:hypothetical protein